MQRWRFWYPELKTFLESMLEARCLGMRDVFGVVSSQRVMWSRDNVRGDNTRRLDCTAQELKFHRLITRGIEF
jgi:hypothetical protein